MSEQLRIRNKGKISDLKILSDKLEVMQKILKSGVNDMIKENIIKRLGDQCRVCGGIANLMVTYDSSDGFLGTIVSHEEKYFRCQLKERVPLNSLLLVPSACCQTKDGSENRKHRSMGQLAAFY